MPVFELADDTALPPRVDAFVFEQDTEFILRADLPLRYPREPTPQLIVAAQRAVGRTPGTVHPVEGAPLMLMAVVHDLGQEPSWRHDWIAAAYAGIADQVKARRLHDLVLPLLGTVHGRCDPVLSLAMLEAEMRVHRVDPRLWLRHPSWAAVPLAGTRSDDG